MKEGGYPHLYLICKKIYSKNLVDAFSVSAILSYYITYEKWEDGVKYIRALNLDELYRSKLTKAFKSYEKVC